MNRHFVHCVLIVLLHAPPGTGGLREDLSLSASSKEAGYCFNSHISLARGNVCILTYKTRELDNFREPRGGTTGKSLITDFARKVIPAVGRQGDATGLGSIGSLCDSERSSGEHGKLASVSAKGVWQRTSWEQWRIAGRSAHITRQSGPGPDFCSDDLGVS